MWALIEDGSITKTINNPRAMVIGDVRHSRKIFELWSKSELEAKGIYEVVFNNTNKKDEAYYTNTNQSFAFADGVVTASFGSATGKLLEDRNEVDEAGEPLLDDNGDQVVTKGLKTNHKEIIKQQAGSLLTPTDWYVVKATEVESYSVPAAMTTYRAAVRTASNDMEALIDACNTVDELAALYAYIDGSRPLGEWPKAV